MLKKAITLALLLSIVIVAGCARSAEVKVSMKNFLFTPAEVTINVGDKVTWINDDVEPHTSTGRDWDSGTVDVGKSYSRVFNTSGTFEFHCVFHPGMEGKVIVKPGQSYGY